MAFFGGHAAPDGFIKDELEVGIATYAVHDGEEPREAGDEDKDEAEDGGDADKEGPGASDDAGDYEGEGQDHRGDGAFGEDAARDADPEAEEEEEGGWGCEGDLGGGGIDDALGAGADEVPRGPEGEGGEEDQEHVGAALAGFPEHDGADGEGGGGEESDAAIKHAAAHAPSKEDGADGGQETGDAVHPDGIAGGVEAGEEIDGEGLGPVDERGLVKAGTALDHGDDKVAGLGHLAAGLREAAFIAVDDWEGDLAGEVGKEADENEEEPAAIGGKPEA